MRFFFTCVLSGPLALSLALSLAGCGKKQHGVEDRAPELTIHAAVSLSRLVSDLGDAFEAQSGCVFQYNFASSGSLARQLIAAPRGDLFFSANPEWMKRVREAGVIDESTMDTLFANQLALVASRDSSFDAVDKKALCSLPAERLSIGDPTYVPVGQYAQAWLQGIDCDTVNAWEYYKDRMIPATDAHAALARVQTSGEMLGIVYLTDYKAKADRLRLIYTVPKEDAPPILYLGATLAGSEEPELAIEFLSFLQSEAAFRIMTQHGFSRASEDSFSPLITHVVHP